MVLKYSKEKFSKLYFSTATRKDNMDIKGIPVIDPKTQNQSELVLFIDPFTEVSTSELPSQFAMPSQHFFNEN